MNVFAVVKDNVTAKDVAMRYGIKINRSGLACCPFHRDKTPSMKIDKRYYCFGCGISNIPCSFKLLPRITSVAISARLYPVALERKGTVREERGLTSMMNTFSSLSTMN